MQLANIFRTQEILEESLLVKLICTSQNSKMVVLEGSPPKNAKCKSDTNNNLLPE